MTKFVLDTWAWIEYFEGSDKGKRVQQIIDKQGNIIVTNWINLAELISLMKRKKMNYKDAVEIITSNSDIFFGDVEFSVSVGLRHAEIKSGIKDLGLVDACVLATAEKIGANIVTRDPHFKGMKNVVMI